MKKPQQIIYVDSEYDELMYYKSINNIAEDYELDDGMTFDVYEFKKRIKITEKKELKIEDIK